MLPEVTAREFPRCGTPRYLAPELVEGKVTPGQAHLVDVYALGAMAFEMFTGRPVFDADSLLQLLEHHLRTPAPPLAELRPDLPLGLSELIGACLRFSSQHCVDLSANAFRVFILWIHGLAIDVQRWSDRYSERLGARIIGIDSCLGLFAIHGPLISHLPAFTTTVPNGPLHWPAPSPT